MDNPKSNSASKGKKDFFITLSLCLILVFFIRAFIIEPFKIPSSSMFPTLTVGDHIFVLKFSYGLSIPFTKYEFYKFSQPKRGDVVVFLFPKDESLYYVKRVVGVPGDTIELKGHNLFINGKIVKKDVVVPSEYKSILGNTSLNGKLYKEYLGDSPHYVHYSRNGSDSISISETIPKDHYFVLGDNRDDSYDSRSWGLVPRENLKGKAFIIWVSIDTKKLWGRLNKIRWERCGTIIK